MKLTVEQALEIRRRYENLGAGGAGQTSLAVAYGVSKSTINLILAGEHVLVRGTKDIRAARRGQHTDGGRTPPMNTMTKNALHSVGDGRAPRRLSEQQKRQYPCHACGARKGEHCVNMIGGVYQRERKHVHDGRGPKTGEVMR